MFQVQKILCSQLQAQESPQPSAMVNKRFYDCKVKLNLFSDMGTSEMKLKNSNLS